LEQKIAVHSSIEDDTTSQRAASLLNFDIASIQSPAEQSAQTPCENMCEEIKNLWALCRTHVDRMALRESVPGVTEKII
jgi:hypothetical protein